MAEAGETTTEGTEGQEEVAHFVKAALPEQAKGHPGRATTAAITPHQEARTARSPAVADPPAQTAPEQATVAPAATTGISLQIFLETVVTSRAAEEEA